MTKVAIWCRHADDNLIGMGKQIPWDVPSDSQKFVRMVTGQNVVVGRKTYETLPGRTLPDAEIFVVTSDEGYEFADKKHHHRAADVSEFKGFEEDLYIAGGAKIYEQFMLLSPKLMPDIIVDCVYHGELKNDLVGEKIDITSCIEIMSKNYWKISEDFEKDNVMTAIYVKRGEFINQAVLKSLLNDIER